MVTRLILNEVFIFLIDGVISQMHEFVVLVNLRGIGLRSKPSQAFLEYVNSQRLIACDQHIDSQVEFMPID